MRKRSEREIQRERHWQEVVRGQRESGQSVRAYCRRAGIEESAFYWWRRKLAGRSRQANDPPRSGRGGRGGGADQSAAKRRPGAAGEVGFLPVEVAAGYRRVSGGRGAESGHAIEIALRGDRVVRVRPGFDRRTLLDVLAALEGRGC